MIGTTVGGYQVTGLLAEGGMGAVWAAKHPVMGRDAVVKLLLPELSHNAEMVRRFFNEARAAASINDPGIVQIFDVGHLPDGRAYIVMERLKGQTLSQRLRERRPQHAADPLQGIRVEETVNILRLLARTLDAAHAHGIVHRDLKPDNIFLVPDRDVAGGERTKILDFGIAKLKEPGGTQAQVTRAGSIFGTPAYMAPEQCNDAATVDARADLYAIGCIAYEMLAGIPPFGFGGVEIIASHMRDEPVPIRQRNASVPPALESIISRLLRKQPDERYASAHELFNALESVGLMGAAPTTYSVPPGTSAGYSPGSFSAGMSRQGSQPVMPVAQTPAPGSMPFPHVPGSAPPGVIPAGSVPAIGAVGTYPPPGTHPPTYPPGTYPPQPASKLPYIIAAAAIAAAAAVVIVMMMKKEGGAEVKPSPGPASATAPVVDKGNPLYEALEAKLEEKWDVAIAAAERVTAEADKPKAQEIAAFARDQVTHQATMKKIEAALAANDLPAAQTALEGIPATSPYHSRAQDLIHKAEEAARVVATKPADPKKPKKDPKVVIKDPKKPPDVVKPPDPKPDPDEEPGAGEMSADELIAASHNALKNERFKQSFALAKAALNKRPGDPEGRMLATISACGMGKKPLALQFLPRDPKSSWREVSLSRCFKYGFNLEE